MASKTVQEGARLWPILSSCPSNMTFQKVRNHPKKIDVLKDIFQKFIEPNYGSQAALAKKIENGEGVKCRLLFDDDKPIGTLVYKATLSSKHADVGAKNGLGVNYMCLTKPLKYGPKGFQSLLLDKARQIANGLSAQCIYIKIREDDAAFGFFLENRFAIAKTFTSPSSVKTHLLVLSLTSQAAQQEEQHVEPKSSPAPLEQATTLEQPREDDTTSRGRNPKRTRSASPPTSSERGVDIIYKSSSFLPGQSISIGSKDSQTSPTKLGIQNSIITTTIDPTAKVTMGDKTAVRTLLKKEENPTSLSQPVNHEQDRGDDFQAKRSKISDLGSYFQYQETETAPQDPGVSWLSSFESGPATERSSSSSSRRSDDSGSYDSSRRQDSGSRRSDDSSSYESSRRRDSGSRGSDRYDRREPLRGRGRDSESRGPDRSGPRERSKFFPMTLKNLYLQMIKKGSKTIEGRINNGAFAKSKAGDGFKFYNQQDSVNCEITKVVKYKSFEEMLKTEGFQALVPNEKDLEAAIRAYEKIPGYSEKAAKFGVVALHLKKVE